MLHKEGEENKEKSHTAPILLSGGSNSVSPRRDSVVVAAAVHSTTANEYPNMNEQVNFDI